ncbi:hypothetical protein IPL68_07400 [Candidatus Saccharibacteria bacterium]|nr:MAG: hypothetical protein IPL68_07400 [Candidatus Saccharibacteria bacterium]
MFGFAGVLIQTSTERPEVLDAGTLVVGGIAEQPIEQALTSAISMRDNKEEFILPADYGDTDVSIKVCKIIQSYTDIVNRTTWRRQSRV